MATRERLWNLVPTLGETILIVTYSNTFSGPNGETVIGAATEYALNEDGSFTLTTVKVIDYGRYGALQVEYGPYRKIPNKWARERYETNYGDGR